MSWKIKLFLATATLVSAGCSHEIPVVDGSEHGALGLSFTEDGEPIRRTKADDGNANNERVGAFDTYNDPHAIDPEFNLQYDALPREGQADRRPWTGSYWPKHKGGIAYRWATDTSHTYDSPKREQALQMTAEEVAQLSPTEKYDLYVGEYDYPLTLRVKAANSPKEASWTGYCHGWTQASIHFAEPKPVTVTNPDGIEIPFGSSDIKALITYFQGDVVSTQWSIAEAPYKRYIKTIGTLCSSNAAHAASCYDSNPGGFHVVLANMVGLRREAFGIDATTTYEKWNHPVHSYTTIERFRRAPDADSAPSAVTVVGVTSTVTYTIEIEPQWDAAGDAPHAQKTKEYSYTLELDANGDIVGGQWLLPLSDGQFMTYTEVLKHFQTLDENGDGRPDLDTDQVSAQMWQYFDFPDYVWTQEKAAFSDEFKPAYSGYAFIGTTKTSRLHLYKYMAHLRVLYEASTH